MSNFLLPHPECSIEQKRIAVQQWRDAAAHERFMVVNNLCGGSDITASRNAVLYDNTANGIQAEIDAALNQEGGK